MVLITAQLGVARPDWGQRKVRNITPGTHFHLGKLGWRHVLPMGRKPVGGWYSAEMRRPTIRSTAQWLDRGDGIDLWGHVMGVRDWIGQMGLICGGTPWGCDTGWIWAMGLSYGGGQWGRATLAGLGQWDWLMGTCQMTKVIGLLNLNNDTMCPHVWRWGKCVECVWLMGW